MTSISVTTRASLSPTKGVATEADGTFMLAAVESAFSGISASDGGPFGAAIVRHGQIVSVAHNTVLKCHDPTNHAEMNCIREACKILGTHDLSDCDIYATCEPCPMCWGACNWTRLRRLLIGVNRTTAAQFGFDDEFFYQELDLPKDRRTVKHLEGIMKDEVLEVYRASPTYRRRLLSGGGLMAKMYEQMFSDEVESTMKPKEAKIPKAMNDYMQMAINVALEGIASGGSKEREPFGAVIIKDGNVICKAHNTVLRDHDPTATAEINVIREASRVLGTHKLLGCEMYTTTEPDPMSLGAIYWSRISAIHVGVSQKFAASFGFEDGLLHYNELMIDRQDRVIDVVDDVKFRECEEVFRKWKELGGELY